MLLFKKSPNRTRLFQWIAGTAIFCSLLATNCSQNTMPMQSDTSEASTLAQVETPTQISIHDMQIPEVWNGDVLVYAHGFVAPGLPIALPAEAPLFSQMALSMGYGFATTSYPANGMVVTEGLTDIVTLVKSFKKAHPEAKRFYLIGASMGALIAAKAAEQYPNLFSGVLAMSGPYGDFMTEVNYLSDFRVIFDYYFPGIFPCSAVNIPPEVMMQWESTLMPTIIGSITNPQNADKVRQLLAVTKIPVDATNPQSFVESILGVLFFDVFATADVQARLGGQPFGNVYKKYSGSDDDAALNAGVERYRADYKAVIATQKVFGTTGAIKVPTITMHTSGDYIIPIKQQSIYKIKIALHNKLKLYDELSFPQYGHVTFTPEQIGIGFSQLVQKVSGQHHVCKATHLPKCKIYKPCGKDSD